MKKREWLVNYREKLQLTQQQVSDTVGINVKYYSLIENGRRNPKPELAKKISDCLLFDFTEFYNE